MRVLLICIAMGVLAGCQSFTTPAPEVQKFEQVYPYTMGEVWSAALDVMERKYFVVADPIDHTISHLEWNFDIERDVERGIASEVNWKERYKYTLTMQTAREGILVTVLPWIEEQVPSKYGGVQWVRRITDGKRERHILSEIETVLRRKRS